MFKGLEFAHPGFLWLLIIVPAMVAWYILREQQLQGSLSVSAARGFRLPEKNNFAAYRHSGLVLRSLAVLALIVALARPQTAFSWQNSTTDGIDIMIASDI
jgi:Ca-activated chloride channel family protein